MKNLIILLILGIAIWSGYRHFTQQDAQPHGALAVAQSPTAAASAATTAQATERFRCDGRTHCSQMRSCAEATYFIRHCPGTKMDGNNDGVPCETQWCR